jgi:hypothetical protein
VRFKSQKVKFICGTTTKISASTWTGRATPVVTGGKYLIAHGFREEV